MKNQIEFYFFKFHTLGPQIGFETKECVSILLKSRAESCSILSLCLRRFSGFPILRSLLAGSLFRQQFQSRDSAENQDQAQNPRNGS